MTRPHELLYLSRQDVEQIDLPMATIIERLEAAFAEKGAGRTEMPPKPGIHTQPDAFIHAMPAYIPALQAAGMKWVSGYPANQAAGLPYISGLLILNDPQTGIPRCVMDCTWITAQRTAAASAVAARHLCGRCRWTPTRRLGHSDSTRGGPASPRFSRGSRP
jgi:ornithine cyclodeaminase/alanine dehydrogenase-like protein (mu-crystallin family)